LGMLRFRDMPPLQSYLEKKVAFFFAFNSENRYMTIFRILLQIRVILWCETA